MKVFDHTIDGSVIEAVKKILGWDQLRYASYQERCGYKYLQCIMPDYPQVVKQIVRSAIFWKWWTRHWENRDKEFIELYHNCNGSIDAQDVYQEINDPRTLAIAIYLNGQALEETYANMIGEITDTQNSQIKEVEYAC